MNRSRRRHVASFRSAPILERYAAPRGLRHVTSGVEAALKVGAVTVLVGVLVVIFAWGLAEQRRAHVWRQRAEAWRALACVAQARDVERRLPFLVPPEAGPPCEPLERLGLTPASP